MTTALENVYAVVIGRNEGDRLKRCLKSLGSIGIVIYVDSGSSDGSAQLAANMGAAVIELDSNTPFTAARARNAGFQLLCDTAPDVSYIQFVDGDCEIVSGWMESAFSFLASHADVAVVSGTLRERDPDHTIYNWLCDREWEGPTGEVRECGGIAMMRASALAAVGSFRGDLIAGEEPELCVRLRAAGWRIWRLDADMALHDAAMLRFGRWWRRMVRSGYADAYGAYLHGAPPEYHRVWESRRAWLWGVWFPLGCVLTTLIFPPWGSVAWVIYPLQALRQTFRNSGSPKVRARLALFQLLSRFPEAVGQIKFLCDHLLGRRSRRIDYK